ncbi:MAG: AMP-dependent synthetase [Desulfobacterales bacterium]|nr:MAG: AMP-dependent synthetase [Desulfobacterales bacterium]
MKPTTLDRYVAGALGLSRDYGRSELEEAQNAALRGVLDWCTRSPFYKELLAGHASHQVSTAADLCRLPFTNTDMLRQRGRDMLCVSQAEIVRVVTLQTSGSTGAPKRIWFTREDLAATRRFFQDGMLNLIGPQDRVLVVLPWKRPHSVGSLLQEALTEAGINVAAIWPPPRGKAWRTVIAKKRPYCVVGLPSHLLACAEYAAGLSVRTMLLCSDYAAPTLRERIEAKDIETFIHYGSTETGLGGGVECTCHRGCHLRESDLLIEIVNPESGQVLEDGTVGEVVITTLLREGMPLLRYRTGDLAGLNRGRCRCGGVTARLLSIKGRQNPCSLKTGRVLSAWELDDIFFSIPGLLDYRAVVENGERLCFFFTALPDRPKVAALMKQAVIQLPSIAADIAAKSLTLGLFREVTEFPADHQYKRTIIDKRKNNATHIE